MGWYRESALRIWKHDENETCRIVNLKTGDRGGRDFWRWKVQRRRRYQAPARRDCLAKKVVQTVPTRPNSSIHHGICENVHGKLYLQFSDHPCMFVYGCSSYNRIRLGFRDLSTLQSMFAFNARRLRLQILPQHCPTRRAQNTVARRHPLRIRNRVRIRSFLEIVYSPS
jgi:hypothetical protein